MAVETAADFGAAPSGSADRWKAEIRAFRKERESWCKRVETIERRYRDEREVSDEERRFALLWANVEVLLPTLYARDPKPEVSRRFNDRDPGGRVLAAILQRNLSLAIERDSGSFGRTMKAVTKDLLLAGQGAAWVRYSVIMGTEGDGEADEPDEMGGRPLEDQAAPAGSMAAAQRAPVVLGRVAGADNRSVAPVPPSPVATDEWTPFDYVHWRDFGFTAGARTWDEVTAVWRRSFLTRDALRKRFPDVADTVPLDAKREGDEAKDETFAKATIYEVWDSTDRTARWVHLGMDALLDERPYPLKIRGRFPCPCPLFGTLTNGSMTPVPDYAQYQDQAKELDELTGRIAALTGALRLVGFTPGDTAPELTKALATDQDVALVPVSTWAAFGGQRISDLVVWLPIDMVVKVISSLQELRERCKQDAYEITGLSDILRGSSNASETATAQSLKAQWGSVRVRTRQQDVQKFAAEALGLMAEVMVGHFDVERLLQAANVMAMPPQDQQAIPEVMQALSGDRALLHYRVDVETDSTVEADHAADKQAWTELLSGVASFLTAAGPVLQGVATMAPQAVPPFAAMLGELLTGAVRRFKAGVGIEVAIEAAFEALGQPQPPPAQGQADPRADARMQAEQGKQQLGQAKLQVEQQRTQTEMAVAQDNSQHRTADRALEQQRVQLEAAGLQHRMQQPGPAQQGLAQ